MKHNPALVLNVAEKWSVKFNTQLLQAAQAIRAKPDCPDCLLLGFMLQENSATAPLSAYLIAELAGRSCWALELGWTEGPDGLSLHSGTALVFESSLRALAQQHRRVMSGGQVTIYITKLARQAAPQQGHLLDLLLVDKWPVTSMRKPPRAAARSRRQRRPQPAEPEALRPLEDGAASAGSEGDSVDSADEEARTTRVLLTL